MWILQNDNQYIMISWNIFAGPGLEDPRARRRGKRGCLKRLLQHSPPPSASPDPPPCSALGSLWVKQVNYEWNGIFWLHAQKLVSMEHIDTKNLGKYFWKSYKSMNLKLTHSLRKTQYLEFEERIRSLTSQGAKRNLHNRTQIFYGQGDKKLHTHQKRRGCPFLPTPEGILFNFCCL